MLEICPGSNRVLARSFSIASRKPASAPPWHGFPLGIAMTAPAPGRGRGRSAKRGRGGGCRKRISGCRFVRGGGRPPPRSPPPVAITTTVHRPRRSRERTGRGLIALGSPKNRHQRCFPDTASHQISPRTAPAPGWGRGRRPKAGQGGDAGEERMSSLPTGGAGEVGGWREAYGHSLTKAGWGMPERNFWASFGPGRGKAPSPVPSPRGDSHHGPVPGEIPGKNRVRG